MTENSTRKRFNRFTPRGQVAWLDFSARQQHRNTIKVLTDLATTLEAHPEDVSPEQDALLHKLTNGSTNRDTHLSAAWEMLEQTEVSYIGKLAAMAPHDLTAYHEMMNPSEPPAHHHIWVCQNLMEVERGDILTLLLSMPPGSAKSTYGSRSFAQWYMGRNPDKRFLAVGHSQKFVEDEFSKPNRNAINQDLYRMAFPDVHLKESERAASFWKLEDWRGSYAARGALAGVAGLRANIIVGDDPFKTAQDALSETIRENIWRWWTADLMSRRLPNAPQVLIMTRWHSEDVAGRIEKLSKENPKALPGGAEGKVRIINVPAQAEADDPLGRPEGEWLWKEFYQPSHYETLRSTMPPGLWAALYLGQPMDTMGEFVGEDDFQRYEKIPVNREGGVVEWTQTVMSVDTAAKGQERSDNTAILVFRKHVDGHWCMIDCWKGKEKMESIIRRMSKMMRTHQVNYALLEDSGMGIQILENYSGKMPSPLVKYEPRGKGSKDFRFDAAVPWITTGKILFPKQAPWLTDFINELVAAPNGANDDQVDAFSQFTDHVLKTRRGGTKPLKMRG